jgi:hypothetical protein
VRASAAAGTPLPEAAPEEGAVNAGK